MPRSKLRKRQSRATAASRYPPNVSHAPSEMAGSRRPLRPHRRYGILLYRSSAQETLIVKAPSRFTKRVLSIAISSRLPASATSRQSCRSNLWCASPPAEPMGRFGHCRQITRLLASLDDLELVAVRIEALEIQPAAPPVDRLL